MQKVIKTFFFYVRLNYHMVFESRLTLIISTFNSNVTYVNAKLWLKIRKPWEFNFPHVSNDNLAEIAEDIKRGNQIRIHAVLPVVMSGGFLFFFTCVRKF